MKMKTKERGAKHTALPPPERLGQKVRKGRNEIIRIREGEQPFLAPSQDSFQLLIQHIHCEA